MTYDGVQVGGFPVECHVDVVPADVEVLVVEGLVDVADELRVSLSARNSRSYCLASSSSLMEHGKHLFVQIAGTATYVWERLSCEAYLQKYLRG